MTTYGQDAATDFQRYACGAHIRVDKEYTESIHRIHPAR